MDAKKVDVISRPGYDALWADFGLSYASFLVMPRSFMHAMPDDWQKKMAELLSEWHATWDWPDSVGETIVQNRVAGKFTKWPEMILNYRHPHTASIEACRSKSIGAPA